MRAPLIYKACSHTFSCQAFSCFYPAWELFVSENMLFVGVEVKQSVSHLLKHNHHQIVISKSVENLSKSTSTQKVCLNKNCVIPTSLLDRNLPQSPQSLTSRVLLASRDSESSSPPAARNYCIRKMAKVQKVISEVLL